MTGSNMSGLQLISVVLSAMYRHGVLLSSFLAMAFFISCSSGFPSENELRESSFNVSRAPYSMVIIIHGDGEYQYYNTAGVESSADIVTLQAAQRTAAQNPFGEVFIFHQKPQRNKLVLFPGRDGEWFYYRYGKLVQHAEYSRSSGRSRFEPESELYHRFRLMDQVNVFRMMLYFGHGIPEFDMERYDSSHPERLFSIDDLAAGLKSFQQPTGGFDLLALSTCYGGSPLVISALAPYARYIIASPDNLHLSYFGLEGLEHLELRLNGADLYSFSKTYASHLFDRLQEEVQTTVSIVLYNSEETKVLRDSIQRWYDHSLSAAKFRMLNTSETVRRCDCGDLSGFPIALNTDGVDVWYRPERFGRDKHKKHHSGWECWKIDAHSTELPPPMNSFVQ
jgi:hypothetical protein